MRKFLIGGCAVVIALLSVMVLTGFKSSDHKDQAWNVAEQRLAQLMEASVLLDTTNQKWVIKINGVYPLHSAADAFQKQVSAWEKPLKLSAVSYATNNGAAVAKSRWVEAGVNVQWMAVERGEHQIYWVFQYELPAQSGHRAAVNTLSQLQAELIRNLQAMGMTYEWNGTVQGQVSNGKHTPEGTVADVAQQFSRNNTLTVEETYADQGTFSASYYAPELGKGVQSGGHTIQLQIAAHQVSGTQEQRVSIGLPLITIEY